MTVDISEYLNLSFVALFWYLLGPSAALSYLIAWALVVIAEAALEEPMETDP